MIRFLAASPRGPALSSRDAAPAALIILRYALRAGYSSSGGGTPANGPKASNRACTALPRCAIQTRRWRIPPEKTGVGLLQG